MHVTIPSVRRLSKAERGLTESAWRLLSVGHRLEELPAVVLESGGNGTLSPDGGGHPSPERAFLARRAARLLGEIRDVAAELERLALAGANGVHLNGLNGS
jgi:hypothetical protein